MGAKCSSARLTPMILTRLSMCPIKQVVKVVPIFPRLLLATSLSSSVVYHHHHHNFVFVSAPANPNKHPPIYQHFSPVKSILLLLQETMNKTIKTLWDNNYLVKSFMCIICIKMMQSTRCMSFIFDYHLKRFVNKIKGNNKDKLI